jgi:aminoglycoside 3-N-acetyltransferase
MSSGVTGLVHRLKRKVAPRGVAPRLKLARLDIEKRFYRRKITHREFREALLRTGEWRSRPVWVQTSLNDFYNVEMRPTEILELMVDLVGPQGTLIMPAYPLNPDPKRGLAVDSAATSTGLLTEMFRRLPGIERSIHLYNSAVALGPDARDLTSGHHLGEYPFGVSSPYGRLIEARAHMVILGIEGLGFTPLHSVECDLHLEVPAFRDVFRDKVTYAWRRRNGESGVHTTFLRDGRTRPARLIRRLPGGVFDRFKLSNLDVQSAPAYELTQAVKDLARRGMTMYVGI